MIFFQSFFLLRRKFWISGGPSVLRGTAVCFVCICPTMEYSQRDQLLLYILIFAYYTRYKRRILGGRINGRNMSSTLNPLFHAHSPVTSFALVARHYLESRLLLIIFLFRSRRRIDIRRSR